MGRFGFFSVKIPSCLKISAGKSCRFFKWIFFRVANVKTFIVLISVAILLAVFIMLDSLAESATSIHTKKYDWTQKELLLFVGIHTAPSHLDRRNAIRQTWMKECTRNPNAVCRFITDGQDPKGQVLKGDKRSKLEKERRLYGDLLLADAPGGINFAVKYLWMIQWAYERYDFQYFLRLDDDYFICFHKLMMELETARPREKLQWGWLHCSSKSAMVTRLDAGFHLVSKDIVESFLSRRDTLMCVVFDGQAIASWILSISNLTTFSDNERVLHLGFTSKNDVVNRTQICHSFLAIHRSYPEYMRLYWSIYEKEDKSVPYNVPSTTYNCKQPPAMDYIFWHGNKKWFSEPKLCKNNPVWGRQGEWRHGV